MVRTYFLKLTLENTIADSGCRCQQYNEDLFFRHETKEDEEANQMSVKSLWHKSQGEQEIQRMRSAHSITSFMLFSIGTATTCPQVASFLMEFLGEPRHVDAVSRFYLSHKTEPHTI